MKNYNIVSPAVYDKFVTNGQTGKLADGIANDWLIGIRESNPAIIDMFRDRDSLPYRDLLPWSGEFAGKHLTGAYYIWRFTGNRKLYDETLCFLDSFVETQAEDGYLGCYSEKCRLTGAFSQNPDASGCTWDAWNHYHAMMGLYLWYNETKNEAYKTALIKAADLFISKFYGDNPPLSSIGSTEMNLAPLHIFPLIYRMTGEKKYLDFAKCIEADLAGEGNYVRCALDGVPFWKCPKPRWESMHPVLGIAELYASTGDEYCLRVADFIGKSILETDVHNTGAFSTNEQAVGNPYTSGPIETCCVVAYNALTKRLYELTGDTVYLEHLQKSLYNAVSGFFSPTGKWSTYDTPMDGAKMANYHSIVFQSRPGSPQLNCCSVNAPRGIGECSEWIFTRTEEGELHIAFYEPFEAGFGSMKIICESNFPAPGEVKLKITGCPDNEKVCVYIPMWSHNTVINGMGRKITPKCGEFASLEADENGNAEYTVMFDFTPRFETGELEREGKTSVYIGSVLYGADVSHNRSLNLDSLPSFGRDEVKAENVAVQKDGSLTIKCGDVVLCDFAHLGVSGAAYRTWLDIK